MLDALQQGDLNLLHEFPNISNGGISVRIANLPDGHFRKCSYLKEAPHLEIEFLAYKILH